MHSLAKEFNLATDVMVEKVEATAEDVILILDTLWERADDIPCDDDARLDFNAITIIAALTGCQHAQFQCQLF